MTADDFACRLCARLLELGLFMEDSEPHRRIHAAMVAYWPEVRQAVETELKEAANRASNPALPARDHQ